MFNLFKLRIANFNLFASAIDSSAMKYKNNYLERKRFRVAKRITLGACVCVCIYFAIESFILSAVVT